MNSRQKRAEYFKHASVINEKYACQQCHCLFSPSELDIDMIIPKYEGGTEELSNLQALCRLCHRKKTLADQTVFFR